MSIPTPILLGLIFDYIAWIILNFLLGSIGLLQGYYRATMLTLLSLGAIFFPKGRQWSKTEGLYPRDLLLAV